MSDIDNELLITLVEERPILWDKTLETFKDRNATRDAWKEICLKLRNDFEGLEEKDRTAFGNELMKRWKHLRDGFARSEKKFKEEKTSGAGVKNTKKYIFHKEMQFLNKIYQQRESTESFTSDKPMDGETDIAEDVAQETCIETRKGTSPKSQPKTKKRKQLDVVDQRILQVLDADSKNENVHMSFFKSLLPHTEQFDSNDWLKFQMEVLRTISNIKDKKNNMPTHPHHMYAHTPRETYNVHSHPITNYSANIQAPYHPQSQPPHYSYMQQTSNHPQPQNENHLTPLTSYVPQQPTSNRPTSSVTKTSIAEHYQQFAEYIEESDRCPSVISATSSSNLDLHF